MDPETSLTLFRAGLVEAEPKSSPNDFHIEMIDPSAGVLQVSTSRIRRRTFKQEMLQREWFWFISLSSGP